MKNHRIGIRATYVFVWLLVIFASGCGSSDKKRALDSTAATIVDGYATLALESRNLNQQAQQFCADPGNTGLQKIQAQWKTTMDAWMRIQTINFGPIRQLDLAYKIQFWPDPRDMVGSQTQAQIKQAEPNAAAMKAKISKATVAVHGLPAIEALLFPDDAKPMSLFAEPGRCQVLAAITANLENGTTQLATAWSAADTGYAPQLSHYGSDDSEFADADAALSVVLGSMVQALESINGSKLGWPLGLRADGVPQPFRVESRRSLHSLENIKANLIGLDTIFTAGEKYGLEDYLRSLQGGSALADSILAKFKLAHKQAVDLKPLYPALQAGDNLGGYLELHATTYELTELLGEKAAALLGVSGGLNFNDGD